MSDRVPGFSLTPVDRVRAVLTEHDWAWARENAGAIARNWERRLAERSGLFDGVVLLACGCRIADGVCEVALFETRYSCFIAFRDAGSPDPAVENAFAAIVPWTSDGAVLLGEMGAHTANAGQVYFACGTPDRDDLRAGGRVDLAGSAGREFQEETGLALPPDTDESAWTVVRGDGLLAFLRPVTFADSAEALVTRISDHWASDPEPELSRIVVARTGADIDPVRMPGYVRAYLGDLFAEQA